MNASENTETRFNYPNKMGRIILMAFEEIMGHTGTTALLHMAECSHLVNNYPPNTYDLGFSFEDISAIHRALDKMYGPHSGRGLALRVGRACFKLGLHEFGSLIGVTDLSFRLLPLQMKIKVGAESFTEILNNYTDQIVQLEERPDLLLWHIERCPLCWGRTTDAPCCHLIVGLLQESLFWLSGGKYFRVEEVSCIAQGDSTCTIEIYRHPLD